MKWMAILVLLCVLTCGCGGVRVPSGVTVVGGFELNRYLGTWYEVARLDHPFERGLTHVRATYSLNKDGSVRVLNQGYDPGKAAWKKAAGRAKFVGDEAIGQLKVSFFGPFYGGYNVIDLDPEYGHALVCGPKRSYLWLLARQQSVPKAVLDRLVERARSLGFAVDSLIFVKQNQPPAIPGE
jgi:apolipoprotein D and lipocalin family protein